MITRIIKNGIKDLLTIRIEDLIQNRIKNQIRELIKIRIEDLTKCEWRPGVPGVPTP